MHKGKPTKSKLPTSGAQIAVDVGPGAGPDRYRVEDALRTLHRAEECRRDRPLMREVKRLAKAQQKAAAR